MDRADFRWPTPPADRFNAPRWSPETVASWGGGSVTWGRVLDATVHSSRNTVANDDRSNALPRHKVHCLSLTLQERWMPRHKHFERRPKQHQPKRELNKIGRRAPTPQIMQRMGDKGLRASPPMEPKAKAKRHECPTCGPVTGSPNVDPKQRRSRLNLGLPWMLTMGRPLLWPTDHPRMPDKESRWMAHRHITVCMPRVTLSIGVGWLKLEPGDGQTVGGASKQVCLEWRASKRARLDWPCR